MACAVVFYSFTGNNRIFAHHLGHRLSAPVIEVKPVSSRTGFSIFLDLLFGRRPKIQPLELDAATVDHILFVGPVWNRHAGHPLLSAAAALKTRIKSYSFATVCGGLRDGQENVIWRDLSAATGREPQHVWQLPLTDLKKAAPGRTRKDDVIEQLAPEHLIHFAPRIDAIVKALGARP